MRLRAPLAQENQHDSLSSPAIIFGRPIPFIVGLCKLLYFFPIFFLIQGDISLNQASLSCLFSIACPLVLPFRRISSHGNQRA
jgi:hypothetical protein